MSKLLSVGPLKFDVGWYNRGNIQLFSIILFEIMPLRAEKLIRIFGIAFLKFSMDLVLVIRNKHGQ